MEQVPKIVTERLRATAVPGAHPDADLLTAFGENSLREAERRTVLEHLAVCTECREVLSFAQAESEGMVAAAAPARQSLHLRKSWWPLFRWGALTACVVVVGAAVLLRYPVREQKSATSVSESDLHIAAADNTAAPEKLPEEQQPTARKSAPSIMNSPHTASAPPAKSVRQIPEVKRKHSRLSEDGGNFSAGSLSSLSAPVPPVAMSPTPGERELHQLTALDKKNEETVKGISELTPTARAEGSAAAAKTEAADAAMRKPAAAKAGAAAAESAQSAGTATLFKPHTDEALIRAVTGPVGRWTISSTGKVLRSLDAGNSWHEVSVGGEGPFRALSVLGPDVWVGGNEGELYHSSDDGEHWTELKLTTPGKVLTADIVHIEFADEKHGTLTTASQETWSTSDGGITWHKK